MHCSGISKSIKVHIVKQSFFKETNKSNRFLFLLLERGEIDLDNKIKQLKEHHNFSVSKLRFYWEQMLEAVKECHIRGVIHTDIKPSNFVLVKGAVHKRRHQSRGRGFAKR